MKLIMAKHFGSLRPTDEAGEEALRHIGNGDLVQVELRRPRNLKHHRRFFALLQLILDNQDKYQTVEQLLVAIKVSLGWFDPVILPSGKMVPLVKSISFAKLSEDEFTEFENQVINLAIKHWLPNVTSAEIRREVEQLTGMVGMLA